MERIGRYEIRAEIGRGSMGVVYLAHDPRLERDVALKTFELTEGVEPDRRAEYQERFLREARAAAALSHPGIVTVYDADWDESRGAPFLAMEHVPGETLKDLLERRERLPADEALALVDVLADALGAAHAAGIVHRDVKPANILLDAGGTAKVADFGVARCATSELTRSGATLGSPAYMSPEQIRGRPVDSRSDLFSLGVILYEALCGKRPFEGDDLSTLAYAIVHESPVPVSRLVSGLHPSIDRFLDRTLAKDPRQRFDDAEGFREELRRVRESLRRPTVDVGATLCERPAAQGPPAALASSALPSSPPRTRWRRRLVVGLVAIALLLGGWWLFGGEKAHLKLTGKSTVVEGRVRLAIDGDEVWARNLAAPAEEERHGTKGKARGFLKKILSGKSESFETLIPVGEGRHEVEAFLSMVGDETVYRSSVVVELNSGQTRRLKLVASPKGGAPITLRIP